MSSSASMVEAGERLTRSFFASDRRSMWSLVPIDKAQHKYEAAFAELYRSKIARYVPMYKCIYCKIHTLARWTLSLYQYVSRGESGLSL